MAFAAGSLSEASAVSVVCELLLLEMMEGLTDYYVGFCGFFFDKLGAVEVADYEADVGEGILDWFALLL